MNNLQVADWQKASDKIVMYMTYFRVQTSKVHIWEWYAAILLPADNVLKTHCGLFLQVKYCKRRNLMHMLLRRKCCVSNAVVNENFSVPRVCPLDW